MASSMRAVLWRTCATARLYALALALQALAVAALVAVPRPLRAAPSPAEDAAIAAATQQVLTDEYHGANFAEAKRKLNLLLDRCKKGKCTPPTKAQIHILLGMSASQIGQNEEAKNQFSAAIQEDATAQLPSSGTTPNIKNQFLEAQKAAAANAPATPTPTPTPVAGPTPVPAAGGGEDAAPAPAAAPTPIVPGKPPPGWKNGEAYRLAIEGLNGDQAGKLDECIEKDVASLKLEEQPRTRLHLASCETRAGKLLDALKDANRALTIALERKDEAVAEAAKQRVLKLSPRISKVTFIAPTEVNDLVVTFDDREVPKTALEKKFSIDPGKHKVRAEGKQNGVPLTFDDEFTVKEGELFTVRITMKSEDPKFLTTGQLKCMQEAQTNEDALKCLPQDGGKLVVRAGLDVSGYTDTNAVHVWSPGINGSVTSPTSGWNVGGSYLVDFVTAASPDIVSTASRSFREVRHAGAINGGYKPGLYGASAHGSVSREPDYLSLGVGGAVTGDFKDKLITPRLAYSHLNDSITKQSSPASVFENKLYTNVFEAGVTVVMSPTSVLVLGATLTTERGDQSKLYRYVPMFTPTIAPRVPVGATDQLVNFFRTPNVRAREQLPTERDRFAIAGRFIHRFTNATLRLEERIYADNWGSKATTTDGRYMQDLGRYLRVWPHVRFHGQSAVNFYSLAYNVAVASNGKITVPTYRTGDRELSPMVTVTAGGGGRIALGSPEASTQLGLTLTGDLMYSRFLNSLFVTTRTAVYGAIALDAEFQ